MWESARAAFFRRLLFVPSENKHITSSRQVWRVGAGGRFAQKFFSNLQPCVEITQFPTKAVMTVNFSINARDLKVGKTSQTAKITAFSPSLFPGLYADLHRRRPKDERKPRQREQRHGRPGGLTTTSGPAKPAEAASIWVW